MCTIVSRIRSRLQGNDSTLQGPNGNDAKITSISPGSFLVKYDHENCCQCPETGRISHSTAPAINSTFLSTNFSQKFQQKFEIYLIYLYNIFVTFIDFLSVKLISAEFVMKRSHYFRDVVAQDVKSGSIQDSFVTSQIGRCPETARK